MYIDDFEVRSYTKSELARLYNPQLTTSAARRLMRRWIDYNPRLKDELRRLGTPKHAHVYSPRQVQAIAEHLGTP